METRFCPVTYIVLQTKKKSSLNMELQKMKL